MILTENEKKVLRLLLAFYDTEFSINQIAKECGLSPNGALKILKKLEREQVLIPKKIANIKSYRINFMSEKADFILELALMPELDTKLMYRLKDFEELKQIAGACILFGSYLRQKNQPNDLDVLFVLDRKNYKGYKKQLENIKQIVPAKIHDIIQTEEDFKKNIKNKDKIINEILNKGVVLWGYKLIWGAVKDVYQRKA